MKIVLIPSPGAQVEVKLKDGTMVPMDQIALVEVTPLFMSRGGLGEMFRGIAYDAANHQIDNFVVTAAGGTGKISCRKPPTEGVVPEIDRKAKLPTVSVQQGAHK